MRRQQRPQLEDREVRSTVWDDRNDRPELATGSYVFRRQFPGSSTRVGCCKTSSTKTCGRAVWKRLLWRTGQASKPAISSVLRRQSSAPRARRGLRAVRRSLTASDVPVFPCRPTPEGRTPVAYPQPPNIPQECWFRIVMCHSYDGTQAAVKRYFGGNQRRPFSHG